MTSEREVEQSTEALEVRPKTDSLEEQNATCGKETGPSAMSSLPSPGDTASNTKEGETDNVAVAEQGVWFSPTTSHGSTYQGYEETYPKWGDQGLYCMPSYFAYTPGELANFDNQSLSHQPYLSSSGYIQQTIFYGSEQVPVYSWDPEQGTAYSQNGLNNHDNFETKALNARPSPSKLENPNLVKTKIAAEVAASSKSLVSRPHQLSFSSNLPGQHTRSLNKGERSNSGIQPVGFAKADQHSTRISSSSYQGHGGHFPRNIFPGTSSTCQTANYNNLWMREKSNMHTGYEASSELVRGPRANRMMSSSSSPAKNELNPFIRRDQFNKPDFQTKYEQAKFFMIKSYSEDDIHKSIKYNVWASTPNGNNKLDAAFREAETATIEKGTKCPVFLFFSVNASGQFVGLAEMTGPVDFKKNMDFWQQDKWNGFFPVTWHIIKDIPNRNFQHITLENNDNKVVTFSRDTQEIKLPQGLRMLLMFKSHPLGTSVLDDFDFYESREKSLHNTKSNQWASTPSEVDFDDYTSLKHLESSFGEINISGRVRESHSAPKHATSIFSRSSSRDNRPSVNRS